MPIVRLACLILLCFSVLAQPQKAIRRVQSMPRLPAPYAMRDWRQVAYDYDRLAFDLTAQGRFLPLISLNQKHVNYSGDSFALVSFVGQDPSKSSAEAINGMASVVGATLSGIDKRNQHGRDFVLMCQEWFCRANGEDVYLNTPSGRTGNTFWYELLPNLLLYQLNFLYPNAGNLPGQAGKVADRYYEAAAALGGKSEPFRVPDFNHLSFRFATMEPADNGIWREPDAAAGMAWIEYMAWLASKDPRHLRAADWGLGFLQQIDYNPFYEMLLPYGAYLAARMNAELGRDYDVGKMLNWCFDGTPRYRRGWGVLSDRWNGLDAHGLAGSITDGDGYAFAMNTYELAGALVPLVRYDPGYAHDIGKWMLNLANASRLFYASAHDAAHQSNYEWTSTYDKKSAIAYEGIRKWKRGAALALADYRTPRGRLVNGSFASTHWRGEQPLDEEVLQETISGGSARLEHIWEFELPATDPRWLAVAARRLDGGHRGNSFRFSYSRSSAGPFTEAFHTTGSKETYAAAIPRGMKGKLYVKVETANLSPGVTACDKLAVDAMAISYRSEDGPYAQGDVVVSFVDLVDDYTFPVVLYRPSSVGTDLGLYGSSHVGILGGIVERTNVEGILRLDLLKTDYYHQKAYPTYLYYNPHGAVQLVEIDLPAGPKDLFDAASKRFIKRGVSGHASFAVPPDSAIVAVVAPAGGRLVHDGKRTLIDGVIVDYGQ